MLICRCRKLYRALHNTPILPAPHGTSSVRLADLLADYRFISAAAPVCHVNFMRILMGSWQPAAATLATLCTPNLHKNILRANCSFGATSSCSALHGGRGKQSRLVPFALFCLNSECIRTYIHESAYGLQVYEYECTSI